MSLISKTGTYRGDIIDSGLAATKNGYPQFIISLRGLEYYDNDTAQWVDWSEVEESEITAYLVLFGSDETPTLNCKQLQKTIGWDGVSFTSLLKLDLSTVKIQFRIETNIYEGKTSLKVNWIDHYDAEPGRTIQKLDDNEVKALDAKYAIAFRKLQSEQQPIRAVSAPTLPNAPAKLADEKPAPKAKRGRPAKVTATATLPVKTVSTPPIKIKGLDKQGAWDLVVSKKAPFIPDERVAEVWTQTIENIAPGGDEDNLTPELWAQVADVVVEQVKNDMGF